MPILSQEYLALIPAVAPVFTKRVWQYVQILLVGAILTPGKCAVTSALQVMGLSDVKRFQTYYRVLNRAVWSSLAVSRILLGTLVHTFAPTGTIVLGTDETIERRRGAKTKAKGIYRDPVRSSRSHFVKRSGLRWLSVMLLAPMSVPRLCRLFSGSSCAGKSRSLCRKRALTLAWRRSDSGRTWRSRTRRQSCLDSFRQSRFWHTGGYQPFLATMAKPPLTIAVLSFSLIFLCENIASVRRCTIAHSTSAPSPASG